MGRFLEIELFFAAALAGIVVAYIYYRLRGTKPPPEEPGPGPRIH